MRRYQIPKTEKIISPIVGVLVEPAKRPIRFYAKANPTFPRIFNTALWVALDENGSHREINFLIIGQEISVKCIPIT